MGDSWPKNDTSKKELWIGNEKKLKGYIEALETDEEKYGKTVGGTTGSPEGIRTAVQNIVKSPAQIGGTIEGGNASNSFPNGQTMMQTIKEIGGQSGTGGTDGKQPGLVGAYSSFLTSYKNVITALFQNAGFNEKVEQDSVPGSTTSYNGGQ